MIFAEKYFPIFWGVGVRGGHMPLPPPCPLPLPYPTPVLHTLLQPHVCFGMMTPGIPWEIHKREGNMWAGGDSCPVNLVNSPQSVVNLEI